MGPIRVGAPSALTGNFDYLQEGVSLVGDLTIKQINEAGGPLDREFQWIQRDTGIDPQEARNVVNQLRNVDNVEVINGLFSSEIPPNWDYLQDQEVPIVSHWPGSRFLDTRGGDKGTPDDLSDDEWVWRTQISDSVHTAGAALNAKDNGVTTVGIMTTSTEGERSWSRGFKDAVNAIDGIEVTAELEVQEGKSSYQSELNRLFSNDFDCFALSFGLNDAVTAIREWDQAGYESAIVLPDGVKVPDLTEQVGDILPDDSWLSLGGASGDHLDQLMSDFDAEHNTENMGAHNHPWAIATYDALTVIALAIHRAGTYDAAEIEKNIRPVTSSESGTTVTTFADGKAALDNGEEINFNGAMSPVNFTPDGNVTADTAVFRPTADGFEELDPIGAGRIADVLSSPDYEVTTGE